MAGSTSWFGRLIGTGLNVDVSGQGAGSIGVGPTGAVNLNINPAGNLTSSQMAGSIPYQTARTWLPIAGLIFGAILIVVALMHKKVL